MYQTSHLQPSKRLPRPAPSAISTTATAASARPSGQFLARRSHVINSFPPSVDVPQGLPAVPGPRAHASARPRGYVKPEDRRQGDGTPTRRLDFDSDKLERRASPSAQISTMQQRAALQMTLENRPPVRKQGRPKPEGGPFIAVYHAADVGGQQKVLAHDILPPGVDGQRFTRPW